ncbi:enoyl-CoA hydratase-related protein [Euzebya sp.]|uniref:enoyl-CoA hydratase-related protein n=1 Tax=Euzebya sp. TaxID=1971409 RepID=UPI003512AEC0
MDDTLVRTERRDAVATITLTNARRRNALSLAVLSALGQAVEAVAATDAAGLVITGEGPVFSSGHDFGDMAGRPLSEMRALLRTCTDVMLALQEIPQVVVARVQGPALAAGCQLVAACDLAVAVDTATFSAPGGKAGWFCHTPMVAIARNVGRKQALEMALTGDAIDAATALRWGLINAAVPAEQLDDATLDLLGRATRGSRMSKALGKQTLYAQMRLEERQAYDLAIEVMAAASQTADGQESMASFVERRPAEYVDR